MTNAEPTPAPEDPERSPVRVLLSPDRRRVAVAIPPGHADRRLWFAVGPDPAGGSLPVVWALEDHEVHAWIPVVDVDELREQVSHWRATGPHRSGECAGRVAPDTCCFPEGAMSAVSDIEDLIGATEAAVWTS